MQLLLVVTAVNVQWPSMLTAPYAAVAWLFASSSTSTGLDCLLGQRNRGLPLSVQKLLFGLFMPLVLLAVLLCLDAIFSRYYLERHPRAWGRRRLLPALHLRRRSRIASGVFAQTTIVLIIFFLPSLLTITYGLFACVQLDAPLRVSSDSPALEKVRASLNVGSFWLLDTAQRCWFGYHRGWSLGAGIPLLLLLCGLVPFGIITYVWRLQSKGQLQEPYYKQHYGFLYRSYKPSKCYWEGVVALQVRVWGMLSHLPVKCIALIAYVANSYPKPTSLQLDSLD